MRGLSFRWGDKLSGISSQLSAGRYWPKRLDVRDEYGSHLSRLTSRLSHFTFHFYPFT